MPTYRISTDFFEGLGKDAKAPRAEERRPQRARRRPAGRGKAKRSDAPVLAPGERSRLFQNAAKLVAKGKLDRAVKALQKILEADPDDARARLKLGDLLARQQRVGAACDAYERVAGHYRRQGLALKAIAVYRQVFRLQPSRPGLARTLEELSAEIGVPIDVPARRPEGTAGTRAEAPTAALEKAELCMQAGKFRHALAVLHPVFAENPRDAGIVSLIAEIFVSLHRRLEAAQVYQELAKLYTVNGDATRAAAARERARQLAGANVAPPPTAVIDASAIEDSTMYAVADIIRLFEQGRYDQAAAGAEGALFAAIQRKDLTSVALPLTALAPPDNEVEYSEYYFRRVHQVLASQLPPGNRWVARAAENLQWVLRTLQEQRSRR